MPSHLSDLVGSVDVASTDAPVGDVDDSIGGVVNIVNDIGAGDAGGVLSYGEIIDNLSASTSYSPSSSSTILIGCGHVCIGLYLILMIAIFISNVRGPSSVSFKLKGSVATFGSSRVTDFQQRDSQVKFRPCKLKIIHIDRSKAVRYFMKLDCN